MNVYYHANKATSIHKKNETERCWPRFVFFFFFQTEKWIDLVGFKGINGALIIKTSRNEMEMLNPFIERFIIMASMLTIYCIEK